MVEIHRMGDIIVQITNTDTTYDMQNKHGNFLFLLEKYTIFELPLLREQLCALNRVST